MHTIAPARVGDRGTVRIVIAIGGSVLQNALKGGWGRDCASLPSVMREPLYGVLASVRDSGEGVRDSRGTSRRRFREFKTIACKGRRIIRPSWFWYVQSRLA